MSSSERIDVQRGGDDVVMRGEQRVPLAGTTPFEATATIHEGATSATYRIPWEGVTMIQRTRIVPDGVEIAQETPYSQARVLLVRARR